LKSLLADQLLSSKKKRHAPCRIVSPNWMFVLFIFPGIKKVLLDLWAIIDQKIVFCKAVDNVVLLLISF
jgi:hypothetical protein